MIYLCTLGFIRAIITFLCQSYGLDHTGFANFEVIEWVIRKSLVSVYLFWVPWIIYNFKVNFFRKCTQSFNSQELYCICK